MSMTEDTTSVFHPIRRFMAISWWRRSVILLAGPLCVMGCLMLFDGLLGLKGSQSFPHPLWLDTALFIIFFIPLSLGALVSAALGDSMLSQMVAIGTMAVSGCWFVMILDWLLSRPSTESVLKRDDQQEAPAHPPSSGGSA